MDVSAELYSLIWPVVLVFLAWANSYLFEGLQSLVEVVEGLPKLIKQVLVIIEQYLVLQLALWTGVPLPEALSGITPEILLALTTGIVGMGIHVKNKPKL